jgi:hypothetical protein
VFPRFHLKRPIRSIKCIARGYSATLGSLEVQAWSSFKRMADQLENSEPTDQCHVWECRSGADCRSQYGTLFELVSHMRSSHNNGAIICGVASCQQSFNTATTWYWHVRREHGNLYGMKFPVMFPAVMVFLMSLFWTPLKPCCLTL